jgi:hypothetical protein
MTAGLTGRILISISCRPSTSRRGFRRLRERGALLE